MDYYEITVDGHLEDYWGSVLDGLSISRLPEGSTCISGNIVDQSQLHGILSRIRDMGLTLVALQKTTGRGSAE